MADIQKLVTMLNELDDQLVNCMRCGMCQAVCPVFAETGREADVARGKLSLLDGLAHEILKDPKGVKDKLDRCLLCGTCQANCPSGVHVLDIFLKARAILTGYFGLSPAKRAIFRQLLTRPELFNKLTSFGSKFQGIFAKPVNDVLGTSCARFQAPVIADRHFPRLASKAFHKSAPAMNQPAGASGIRVAFFPGCMVDKVYPQVGHAVLKVLAHHGVGVFMPHGQACCGIPALSSGDRDSFEKMVGTNAELFANAEFDYILTPCATCSATLKDIWPTMVDDEGLKARIAPVSAKVLDISEFLVDVLGVTALEGASGKKVTYHDPCHLRNSLHVTAQPRTVLQASGNTSFVELPNAATCCGCGGSFSLQHYDLSKKIGDLKAKSVEDSGAETLATSCPACMMQIADRLSQRGHSVPVKHVVEVYADSLG